MNDAAPPSPDDFSANGRYAELRADQDALRNLFLAGLGAVLLLSFALNIFLLRQMIVLRDDLAVVKPQITQLMDNYGRVEEPQVRNFINTLVAFGRTHPDFNPVLVKYKILSEIPAPATPSFTPTAPAKKK